MVAERMAGPGWARAAARPELSRGDWPRIVTVAIVTLELWAERRRQRRALAALPPALLRDIGISAADAQGEAMKPFWRA